MATTATAIGQITIVDLNDAKQVQAYLLNSGSDVQIYNPDTEVFTPNYASEGGSIIITPKVYVTGNASDVFENCINIKWEVNNVEVTSSNTSYVIQNDKSLKIKSNLTNVNSLLIKFSADYREDSTDPLTHIEAFKTIIKSSSTGALFQAVITTPNGTVFDASVSSKSLTAVVQAYRGGTEDVKIASVQWYKLNISTGAFTAISGANTKTLTVNPDDVLNFQTYKVVITDNQNNERQESSALVTFEDKTDPYTIEVLSTTGDKLKNGLGSTTIFARVYRSGVVIEDENTTNRKFDYTWTMFDQNGHKVTTWGNNTGKKTTPSITVTAAEITNRATFFCEVTEK